MKHAVIMSFGFPGDFSAQKGTCLGFRDFGLHWESEYPFWRVLESLGRDGFGQVALAAVSKAAGI